MEMTIVKIREIGSCFWQARILLTAVELKLFDVFDTPLTSEEVAERLKLDKRATSILLDALVAMGILEKKQKRFIPVPIASTFLRTDSERYPGGGLRHMMHLWKSWSRLTEIVKTGHPARKEMTEEEIRDFILGMEHLAEGLAERVATIIDLSKINFLLDLGAGSGAYTAAFLRHYSQLKAVLFDRPLPIEIAKELLRQKGIDFNRVKFIAGDFLTDEIGQDYDFVWMSSIIHSLGEEENKNLFKKVHQALKPGGQIAVRDFLLDETGTKPAWAAIFSVNMLVNTEKGRSYKEKEVVEWLEETGFKHIERLPLDERSVILLGKK